MPYAPGVTDISGQLLAQGISGAVDSIAGAWEERKKQEQMNAYNDAIVHNALNNGDITLEDYNKYDSMSGKQKTGFAAGLAANIHDKWQRTLQQSELDKSALQQRVLFQQLKDTQSAANWKPDQGQAQRLGGEFVETGPGQFKFAEYPNKQQDTWETLNKDARAATGYDLGDWQGAKNKRVENGYVVGDIVKPNVFGDEVQHTIRVPKTTYDQFLGRFNNLKGGQPGADIGVSREQQVAEVKKAYDSKQITREEAIRKLKELGIE